MAPIFDPQNAAIIFQNIANLTQRYNRYEMNTEPNKLRS